MESREAESCILAGMLISSLGWYDWWHKGGGLYALIGVFGMVIAGTCAVFEYRDRKKR